MDKICIPQTAIENFKCVLCHRHVFVSPITTKDERSFKCGRCSFIKSDHSVQAHALEKMASYMKFPCTFEGCDVTIPWGEVTDHEKTCNYRVINCPSGDCNDSYPIHKIVPHFVEKHKNHMTSNEYQLNNSLGACLRLNFYNQQPYLLFFYENNVNIWISVYSISTQDDNVLFQVQFHGSNTNKSLIFQAEIIPFNDQEHCLNCLDHICTNNYHKYSEVNKDYDNVNESMAFVIEKSYLKTTLGSEIAYYTVKITEEKESLKDKKEERQQAFLNNLECPVCHGLMSAPIYSCMTGHAICNNCRKKLTTCPLCLKKLTESRCFALEGVAENIRLFCCNRKKGCIFTGNVDQCTAHEEQCSIK